MSDSALKAKACAMVPSTLARNPRAGCGHSPSDTKCATVGEARTVHSNKRPAADAVCGRDEGYQKTSDGASVSALKAKTIAMAPSMLVRTTRADKGLSSSGRTGTSAEVHVVRSNESIAVYEVCELGEYRHRPCDEVGHVAWNVKTSAFVPSTLAPV